MIRHIPALFFLLAAAASAQAGDPFAGAEIYTQHCLRCHGADGGGNNLDVIGFRQSNAMLQPDTVLIDTTSYGSGLMPAYRGMLDEQQIEDVVSYVRTLF